MKYIFLDIDGTILSHTKGISDKTKYAIKNLREKGYKVLICSGRHISIINNEILDLEYDGFILANGAFVYYQGQYILNESFKKATLNKIIDFARKNDFIYYLEAVNVIYTNSLSDPRHLGFVNGWNLPNNFSDKIDEKTDINIIMLIFNDNFYYPMLHNCLKDDVDLAKHFKYPSCDVNIKGINKAYGIRKLLEYLDEDVENTMAFGDGLNDIEMINYVNKGIAMGNACDELKKIADDITLSVEDDGVYHYLLKNAYIDALKE